MYVKFHDYFINNNQLGIDIVAFLENKHPIFISLKNKFLWQKQVRNKVLVQFIQLETSYKKKILNECPSYY